MADLIQVKGLDEFIRSVDRAQADLPKAVRAATLGAAELVAGDARPRIATMTGRALSSLKVATSSRSASTITAIGPRASVFGWSRGFYITRILNADKPKFEPIQTKALLDVVKAAGLEVT